MDTWIVLVEAATATPEAAVDPTAVESLLTFFADESPAGLYAPDRYALQVWKVAERAELALTDVLRRWRLAAAEAGLGGCRLVRAELMTPAELDAESGVSANGNGSAAGPSHRLEALEAVQEATRAVLRARSPKDASRAVVGLVHRLGGSIVLAEGEHPYRLPIDLSFGEGHRLAPAAVPFTPSRSLLEEHVPPVVDDAWHVLRSHRADQHRADQHRADDAGRHDRVVRHKADVEVVGDRPLERNRGWRM